MRLCQPHNPCIFNTQNHLYYQEHSEDCISPPHHSAVFFGHDLGTSTDLSGDDMNILLQLTVGQSLTSPHNPRSCVFSRVTDIFCPPPPFSPLLSSEYVFSLRSIPLLLGYITALIWATVEQQRCKGCRRTVLPLWLSSGWKLRFKLTLTFQPT